MKRILITLCAIMVLAYGCQQNPPTQNAVTIENTAPAGFDVNKLAGYVKTSTDPEKLEKAINDPSTHINNLDLDKDGNVDYLKVQETEPNHLNIVDDVSASDSVTVARIKIQPDSTRQTADLNIQGNPNYVGYDNYYHSSFGFTDFLLLSYMMRPHMYYMPMYHYGYYPHYYTRVRTVTNFRPTTSSHMSSRMNTSTRSSLGSSGRSQRSFGTRNSSTVRSGGFGRHSSSGSSRSFGRSGFGRGRRR